MAFDTYLHFKGNCAEAFHAYKDLFGATQMRIMTWGQSPMADQTPAEQHGEVMYARLQLGANALMGADAGTLYAKPQGFRVSIEATSVAEAERLYAALSEGGEVFMAMTETFWAHRFGMLTDRFGIPWMINHSKPMPVAETAS